MSGCGQPEAAQSRSTCPEPWRATIWSCGWWVKCGGDGDGDDGDGVAVPASAQLERISKFVQLLLLLITGSRSLMFILDGGEVHISLGFPPEISQNFACVSLVFQPMCSSLASSFILWFYVLFIVLREWFPSNLVQWSSARIKKSFEAGRSQICQPQSKTFWLHCCNKL